MKFLFLLFAIALTSCANTTDQAGCGSESDHTTIENDRYKVYIYNPDSLSNPTVWEGPICSETNSQKTCEFTESLIKSVEFSDSDTISIVTFSGSNSKTTNLNLATCSIKRGITNTH